MIAIPRRRASIDKEDGANTLGMLGVVAVATRLKDGQLGSSRADGVVESSVRAQIETIGFVHSRSTGSNYNTLISSSCTVPLVGLLPPITRSTNALLRRQLHKRHPFNCLCGSLTGLIM